MNIDDPALLLNRTWKRSLERIDSGFHNWCPVVRMHLKWLNSKCALKEDP